MKKDGRLTDAAGYAPTVRRRKLLTNLITRAAERDARRRRFDQCPMPCGRVGEQFNEHFQAYITWTEAWINAIKEERKCLNPTQYKAQQRRPMPPQYYRAGSPPKKKESGGTP